MNEPKPPNQPTFDSVVSSEDQSSINRSNSNWRGIVSTILILVAAPLIALFLTAYVFQSYEVDGPSMETTLQNHDRLIVLKVPRTISRLTGHQYIPNRGDVIVFVKHNLVEYGQFGDKQLIKRVIGLPGDRVVVSDGKITIYNSEHPTGFDPDSVMPYGKVIHDTPGEIDVTVPPGQIFVCGDNRTNSLDSRSFQPATIPSSDIVGHLVLRLFPINKVQAF